MKKIFLVLVLCFTTLTLSACLGGTNDENSMTDEEKNEVIDSGIDNIDIAFSVGETLKSILSDITLETKVESNEGELDVIWDSSNTQVISNSGVVTPDRNDRKDVTLTATVSYSGLSKEKAFEATVLEFDSENTAYSRALQYFRNASFDPIDSLPNSITSDEGYQTASDKLSKCAAEINLDEGYEDDCFTKASAVNTQSDAYEDILEVINTFGVIKEYSTLAEDIVTSPQGDIARNVSISVPTYGAKIKVLNTGGATENSYTFATNIKTTVSGVSLDLSLQNELKFNEDTNTFTASYTFDIKAGYSLFNVTLYTLTAEVTTNVMYELESIEIASKIPYIGSKMTKMVVNDDASIELFSYRENIVLSDYKSYIFANEDYGVSYYWTSGNPLNPLSGEKSSYELFTPEAKLYELNFKGEENEDDTGAAKFYFSGINNFDRIEVNQPFIVKWGFKITNGIESVMHKNAAAGQGDYRIEKESSFAYVDKLDENGNLIGYNREKTGEDVYYISVYNNDLYHLPQELRDIGMTTQVTGIENLMTTMKGRLNTLQIMNKQIFEEAGKETGAKITVTIPGINKTIAI